MMQLNIRKRSGLLGLTLTSMYVCVWLVVVACQVCWLVLRLLWKMTAITKLLAAMVYAVSD